MTRLILDDLSEEALTARSDAAGEPAWLLDRRLAAFKRSLDQSWPDSRRDEFWRSTPFERRFNVDRVIVGDDSVGDGSVPESVTVASNVEAGVVRLVDGRVLDISLPQAMRERGVVVSDLATAAREHADLVEAHLGSLTTSNPEGTGGAADRTVTVNDAAWHGGVFVHVPAEVELAEPITIQVHVATSGAHLPRVLVVAGHHARASVYLEHTSSGDVDALVDEVVEVVASDASHVDLVSLQRWGAGIQHLSLQKVAAHRDSTVRHLSVTTGGATVRLLPECDLVGPGASVRPLGIYFADEGQWFDLQPYVRHLAGHARSDVLFKGALQGASRTVFRGNVFIHRDAVGSVTDENNRSLILTEGARADATPFLEIECADVTAGHGSATGQIDARQLFYLEARGIPRDEALRLIVFGFFRQVLLEMDLPGVEAAALHDIESRIEAGDLERIQVNDASLQGPQS